MKLGLRGVVQVNLKLLRRFSEVDPISEVRTVVNITVFEQD